MRRSKKVYELYVCPKCYHQVNKCTCKQYPPWQLIMVDRKIQPHVRRLNEKGYDTTYCCESHEPGGEMYIEFQVPFRMLFEGIELPEGFSSSSQTINCRFPKDCSDIEAFKDDAFNKLMIWIEKLPNSKYYRPERMGR